MANFPVHPAAELFPMMDGEQYARLRDDISRNGLREPIVLCEAKVLDGRNRLKACDELSIEPKFTSYDGDSPTAFVWSLNGARRQLTKSQLATIAVEMLPHLQEEAAARSAANLKRGDTVPDMPKTAARGTARDIAAELVGVGHSIVQRAAEVKRDDPKLFERVKTGEVTVEAALRNVKQARPIPPKPRNVARDDREKQIRSLAEDGNRAAQIAEELGIGEQQVRNIARERGIALPDAVIGKVRKIDAHRVIESTVHGLEGYAQGLQTINGAVAGIDREDATAWTASLHSSLAIINKLHKQLRNRANGN